MDDLAIFVYVGIPLMIYIVPMIVAHERKHHQFLAITVLNLLLGWTVLGWIAALVWACTSVIKPIGEK